MNKSAVLGWGRGMGHTGHDALVQAVIHQAEKTNSQPFFVVSRSFSKDDPIPPETKLKMYQKKFPKYANIFSLPSSDKPTINDVLASLATAGYKNVTLVVGADQKDAFGYLTSPAKSTGIPPYKSFGLDSLTVLSRQDTKAPSSDPTSPEYHEGPRATPMRQVLLDPSKSEQEQFQVWRDSMSKSLSDEEVYSMMKLAKDNLQKFNAPKEKVKKLKEFIEKMKPLLKEANAVQKQKIYYSLVEAKQKLDEIIIEDKAVDPISKAVVDFYKPVINDIHKEKVDNYVEQARELIQKTDDLTVRKKLIDIFKKGKENPYVQGGIITTIAALLTGGLLSSANKMGLNPSQTNILLQAVLNTVIPTVVSRINGKNWSDTMKVTLASAGTGTGIATLTEKEISENLVTQNQDYLEEK